MPTNSYAWKCVSALYVSVFKCLNTLNICITPSSTVSSNAKENMVELLKAPIHPKGLFFKRMVEIS